MEKIIINNTEIGSLNYLDGFWKAKPSSDKVCRFAKKEEAELYIKRVYKVDSNMDKIKEVLKKHHNITDVKKNKIKKDEVVFVLSGKFKDTDMIIELWANDYTVDIHPKNISRWNKDTSSWHEGVFRGTLLMEGEDGNR